MGKRALVVGGAGYIGSHTARNLLRAGWDIAIYDDLSTGHREACLGHLFQADLREPATLRAALREYRPDAVLHFAARALVGESVAHPLRYWDTNVGGTASLLRVMLEEGVRRLVFSSSCAVYGLPAILPVNEQAPFAPVSPYGRSKALAEEMLVDARNTEGLQVTALRYFNAAGAALDGALGEAHHPETHLSPLAIAAASGDRPPLSLFGTDYPTPDGTCIRDYVHVEDLAEAHRLALDQLLQGSAGSAWTLGTGTGSSNRQVLECVGKAVGRSVPWVEAPRREGDPAGLWADPTKIIAELGWRPRVSDLQTIVRTAVQWYKEPRFRA